MNDNRIILNLSGGATKISGIFGAADFIYNKYKYRPTDITGISSGALLTVPIALRKFKLLRNIIKNFTLEDIFDKIPINNGKLTLNAKFRALFGKSSFGTQNNLYKTICEIVTEKDFYKYQNGNYPNCFIGAVDFKTGKRIIVNIKNKQYTYIDYVKLVNASASIPMVVESVKYNNMLLYDGGVRNHILSSWCLENIKNIKEVISIYSRPQNYINVLDNDWKDKNIKEVFERLMDIQMIEISKKDEIQEKLLTDNNKIKLTQIFIPYIIKELFDVNPIKLKLLYNAGYVSAYNKLLNNK